MLEDLKTEDWDFNYNLVIRELTSWTILSVHFSTIKQYKKYKHLLCARHWGGGLCLGQHTMHINILNTSVNINVKISLLFTPHKNPRKLG